MKKTNSTVLQKTLKFGLAIADNLGDNFIDRGTSLHWEAFYRIEATKNIAIFK